MPLTSLYLGLYDPAPTPMQPSLCGGEGELKGEHWPPLLCGLCPCHLSSVHKCDQEQDQAGDSQRGLTASQLWGSP